MRFCVKGMGGVQFGGRLFKAGYSISLRSWLASFVITTPRARLWNSACGTEPPAPIAVWVLLRNTATRASGAAIPFVGNAKARAAVATSHAAPIALGLAP